MPSKPIENGDAASKPELQISRTEELLESMNEKLGRIEHHLRSTDRRDRLRMWTGIFWGFVHMIPALLIIGSVVYAYYYGDDLIKYIASRIAQQAVESSQQNVEGLIDSSSDIWLQLQQYFSTTGT